MCVNNELSDKCKVNYGVPQGSILGPLLFIIYVNDFPLNVSDIFMYADDTTAHATGKSVNTIEKVLQEKMNMANGWCSENKLFLNEKKCKVMLLSSKGRYGKVKDENINVEVNGIPIENVENHKILGLQVDRCLTWEKHISIICQKIAAKINILRNIKSFLPFNVRKIYFNAYILPHFDFCCTIWGGCNKTLLNKLKRLHKFAAYQVMNIKGRCSYQELLGKLYWLSIEERLQYKKAVEMYKIMYNLAPSYLREMFVYVKDSCKKNLRSSTEGKLYLLQPKTDYLKTSLAYSGAVVWNSLPMYLKDCTNLKKFKSEYLKFILKRRAVNM